MNDTAELQLAPVQPGEEPMKQLAPFDEFKTQVEKLKSTAETLTITDINDRAGMKLARATRLALKDVRVAGEKRRKELGEHHLRETQRINADWKSVAAIIEPLETRLLEQEEFAEREQARIWEEKRTARHAELAPFLSAPVAIDLGTMKDEDYAALLADTKAAHQAKLDREAKALAEAAAQAEEAQRRTARVFEIAPFRAYVPNWNDIGDLGVMTQETYAELLTSLRAAKKNYDDKQEQQRQENERLQKEAAAREAEIKAERERVRKEQEAAAAAARAELEAQKAKAREEAAAAAEAARREREAIEAKAKAEAEAARQEQIKREVALKAEREKVEREAAKEREKAAAELKKANEQAAFAAREALKIKQALEKAAQDELAEKQRIEAARLAAEKKAAAAPDREKLLAYGAAIGFVPLPELSDANRALHLALIENLDNLTRWIAERAEEL